MPPEQKTIRKLRAILSADVKGYSLLMADNEAQTIQTLKSYRQIMFDLILQHSGRVIDSPGDNLLAEFGSAVDALECAVDIQKRLKKENTQFADDQKLQFRIGINIGDVVQDEDRIYGSGVNIAARIEGLADPGGICISRNVYDQIKDKLKLGYEYLGQHEVKNIKDPVRVYRVLSDPEDAGKLVGEEPQRAKKKWVLPVIIVAAIIVVSIVWHFYQSTAKPDIEPASIEKMALPLPDLPSIAVLPFVNMSGDPKQEFFSDAITENIITVLSKVPRLFVISRQSTFFYKGKPVMVKQVSEELGVQYVLEGSVQRSADRIRIHAQLIDALTGHHLWAERYERDQKDLFAVQDEITMRILQAIRVKLSEGEISSAYSQYFRGKQGFDCYLKIMEAAKYTDRFTLEAYTVARRLLEEAISICPENPIGYVRLGWAYRIGSIVDKTQPYREALGKAKELVKKALAMDDSLADAHILLSILYRSEKEYDKSIAEGRRAVELDPSGSTAYTYYAAALLFASRPEEAIPLLQKAIRLNPNAQAWTFVFLGHAFRNTGRLEEAVSAYKKVLKRAPDHLIAHIGLATTYSLMGREEEARVEAQDVLRINPKFSLIPFKKTALVFKDKSENDMVLNAMTKALLPHKPPLPLPDKPSIAVLAFENMSEDPKQEYFSDGISEDIITALSKTDQLFVIARNSTFTYKGKPVKVKQVAEELGVRYVLEGSVRKTEDRVRVTAQLIDAISGHHLWAERYDRDLKDIFALQDEIMLKIVTALQIKLTEGEQARMMSKETENIDLYLKRMESLSTFRKGTVESNIRYGQISQEMIDMAPEASLGYRCLGWHYWMNAMYGKSPRESIAKAFKLAKKALSLDESNALSHALLGNVYLPMRKYEKAIAAGERAVELAPNGAMVNGLFGVNLGYAGRPDEAIGYLNKGIRLNPFPAYWYFTMLGRSYMQKGQYEEALTEFKKALHRSPDALTNHRYLTAIYVLLDRQEEAEAAAKKVLELHPSFSVKRYAKIVPYKNPADLKLFVDALRKAGLPE